MENLVTGGAGFIGSNLVRALVAAGESVRVLDNFATGRHVNLEGVESGLELIEGDIRNMSDVKKAVDGVKRVYHLAALPSVVRSIESPVESSSVNIQGMLNVLEASRVGGVETFVFSSSSSVYGDTPVLPKQEDMHPSPLSPYALQKLAGEHYCRLYKELYGFRAFALRYFNVFGPRQNPESDYAAVVPAFIASVINGTAPVIHGDGGQTRDFTFVADVVSANIACAAAPDSAAGGVYNAAWGLRTSIKELAEMIIEAIGADITPEFGDTRPGDVRDSQADSTRAREALGWQPAVTFEDGLKQTIEWFSE
jgi:nucleoside-diphosphate-sugar epimerase